MKDKKRRGDPHTEALLHYANNIIATLREPFLVLDKNLKVVSTNQAFLTTFKVVEKDTLGRLLLDLGNRQWNIPKLLLLLKEILPAKKVVKDYEVEHIFEQIGERIMVLNACEVVIPKKIVGILEAGTPAAEEEEEEEELILLAIEDITVRRKVEQIAAEAREFAERIVETIRESLIVMDADLKVISANKYFYQTFKVSPEETRGQFIYDLGNRQWDIPKLRELLEDILPHNAAFDGYEIEHDFSHIGRRTMVLNARRIPRPPAKARIILLAIEDITERKKVEVERLERLKELACLYAITKLVETEDNFGKILQGSVDLMAQSWFYPEVAVARITYKGQQYQTGNFRETDWRQTADIHVNRQPDGMVEVCYLEERPLRDEGPFLKEERSLIHSIAERLGRVIERMRAEEQIKQLNAELKVANKNLEDFSYSVAHDLRAPLRAIVGFANIFSEDYQAKLDDEGRRLIGVINDNVIKMGELINDLLDLSRMSRQEMRTWDIDMTELAQSVFDALKEELFRDRAIEVSVKPMPIACADPTLTKQIFTNLISNAMKFTSRKDKALIEIGGYDKGQERVYYVKDNGAGFDMKYADKLFGIFQRLHSQDEFRGTGIGLAIVRSAVLRHEGRVWAEAEVGQGATFYFTLPKGGQDGHR